jgi:nucleoside-diphosphate-sugar epimerase
MPIDLDQPASDSLVAGENPPLIHIGSGEDQTILELAELVAEVVDFDGRLTFGASKPDGTPRKLLDSSKLSSLGWTPKTTLREGLHVACREFLELRRAATLECSRTVQGRTKADDCHCVLLTNKSFWWIV